MIVEELSMLAADSVRTISLFGFDFCGVFYRWGDFSLSEVFLWWSDLFQSDLFLCSAHTHTLAPLVLVVPECQFMFVTPLLTWLQAGSKKTWGGGRQWQMAPEILWKAITSTPHKMQFPPATLECCSEISGDRVGQPTLWWTRYCDELPWMWLDRRTTP